MMKTKFALAFLLLGCASSFAQARRKVIINEDCSGPGGSNMQTLLTLIQSPRVEVLGITVVSGDAWRDEEVAHTLRLLEIIGRTDIPVVPGASFPLVRTREESQVWQERYGKVAYAGAWDERSSRRLRPARTRRWRARSMRRARRRSVATPANWPASAATVWRSASMVIGP